MANTVITVEGVKEYELRELSSKDIFPVFNIMGKIGFKEFKSCFEADEVKAAIKKAVSDKEAKDTAVEDITSEIGVEVFINIAGIVISHLSSCEDDIYTLLSGLSGMTKKEISELPLGTFAEMIIDVVKAEGFKDFIKVVSKLFK